MELGSGCGAGHGGLLVLVLLLSLVFGRQRSRKWVWDVWLFVAPWVVILAWFLMEDYIPRRWRRWGVIFSEHGLVAYTVMGAVILLLVFLGLRRQGRMVHFFNAAIVVPLTALILHVNVFVGGSRGMPGQSWHGLGWLVVLASLLAVGWQARKRHEVARLRASQNHCIHCGYDRHGLSDEAPCPECGQERKQAIQV